MLFNHLILGLLWIVYGILHSYLAHESTKKKLQQHMGKKFRYYRIYYVLFVSLSFAAIVYYQLRINTVLIYKPETILLIAGCIICFSGLCLMIVCIAKYFMRLSGLRYLVQEEDKNVLMITGVHRYVRHPLYLGTFAFIWGLFLLLPYLSLLISNLIITIYTLVGIKLEEEKLVSEFGDAYLHYRQRVPKLFPFLKNSRRL